MNSADDASFIANRWFLVKERLHFIIIKSVSLPLDTMYYSQSLCHQIMLVGQCVCVCASVLLGRKRHYRVC